MTIMEDRIKKPTTNCHILKVVKTVKRGWKMAEKAAIKRPIESQIKQFISI